MNTMRPTKPDLAVGQVCNLPVSLCLTLGRLQTCPTPFVGRVEPIRESSLVVPDCHNKHEKPRKHAAIVSE